MIRSIQNANVKNIVRLLSKKKERYADKRFVLEGLRFVSETPLSLLREIYVDETFKNDPEKMEKLAKVTGLTFPDNEDEGLTVLKTADGYEVSFSTVTDDVMRKMADTESPQGVLAVSDMPLHKADEILNDNKAFIVVLEDIQDPGNLGTIVRTAEGAGVTGIIMSKNTVDIFSPKASRATMGSIFRVPFFVCDDMGEILSAMKEKNIKSYAAYLGTDKTYTDFNYKEKCAFLIGNEGNGLKRETAESCDVTFTIPMGGQLESLNAAMAAGILMYEAARQRRD